MKAEQMNKISAPIGDAKLRGKTVVVSLNCLAPEYREGDRRLLCTEGFGCDPALRGKAVYGIFRGERGVRFDRRDLEGLAAHPLKEQAHG